MFHFGHKVLVWRWAIAAVVAAMATLPSCDHLYDDLPECDAGARLRFVYDYNMEWANAFPSQVHCLTVLVYDTLGVCVATRTETAAARLGDEAWRMTIDLAPGRYHVVAYGGLACDSASFAFVQEPTPCAPIDSLRVAMTAPPDTLLHPFFYGATDIDIAASALDYTDDTVRMMKNTNVLRFLLQNASGQSVNDGDFCFAITAEGSLFAADNSLLHAPAVTYTPWCHGQAVVATDTLGRPTQLAAYAEVATSRLVIPADAARPTPRLTITRRADGETVFSYALLELLMLYKHEYFATLGNQEYLDRESRWTLGFFLDKKSDWSNVVIKINGWEVRLNDATW